MITSNPTREQVLAWIENRHSWGATRVELIEWSGMDGGPASGKLSVLAREGKLKRLAAKRGHYSVYVEARWVMGREIVEPARNRPCPHCGRRRYDEEQEGKRWVE